MKTLEACRNEADTNFVFLEIPFSNSMHLYACVSTPNRNVPAPSSNVYFLPKAHTLGCCGYIAPKCVHMLTINTNVYVHFGRNPLSD